jgi:hypothetical protein
LSHTFKSLFIEDPVIRDLFARLEQALNEAQPDYSFQKRNVAPIRHWDGMVVYADGTNWNPGSGEGLYRYGGGAWNIIGGGGGAGTVTTVSVVSANGFAGTVATATTTPAITLTTSITGILKGNGTAISAAVAADFPTLNQNTTGSAATLTTPRAIYGNNFDGSAALTSAVTVAFGGTGRATSTTAYGLIAAGTTATGAHQTLAAGATTEILVGGGASALPVWTTATGSGAPVRATSPTLTRPILGSSTFAGAASAASNSGAYLFITDLGANGALCRSNGSRWLPVGGRIVLKQAGASGAIGTTRTIVCQTQVPAGYMTTGDVICVTHAVTKSGAVDVGHNNVTIGTGGTTGDTSVMSAQTNILLAANVNAAAQLEFMIASATTAQRLGAQSGNGYYGAGTANATQAATAISNVSNALWINLAISSAGATNTVTSQYSRIELITG